MKSLTVHDAEFYGPVLNDPAQHDALRDWAAEHGADVCQIWGIELHLIDLPLVRFLGWEFDESGNPRTATGLDGEPDLVERTWDVPMRREPPVAFRG